MNVIKNFENGVFIVEVYVCGNIVEFSEYEVRKGLLKRGIKSNAILRGYIFGNRYICNQFTTCRDLLNWHSEIFYSVNNIIEYYNNNLYKMRYSCDDVELILLKSKRYSILNKIRRKNNIRIINNIKKNHASCIMYNGVMLSEWNKTTSVYCTRCGEYI